MWLAKDPDGPIKSESEAVLETVERTPVDACCRATDPTFDGVVPEDPLVSPSKRASGPNGLPVGIRSPGASVIGSDASATGAGTVKIVSSRPVCCFTPPFW
jgi:hypothetical protein